MPEDQVPGAVPPPEPTNPPEPSDPGNPGGDPGAQFVEIGGEKLPLDQAAELVKLGRSFKPIKEQYPAIDFGGMAPTFTKQSQLLSDPEKLEQYLQEKYPDRYRPADPNANNPEIQQAIAFMEQSGFVRQDKLDQYYQQRRQAEQYDEKMTKLSTEIDGKDGRPKFDRQQIEEFMLKRKDIFDPMVAYETLHRDAVREWYLADRMKRKPAGTGTERSGAGIQLPKAPPTAPKFGSPEMRAAMAAVMGDDETV
jgi:hypothetical protein